MPPKTRAKGRKSAKPQRQPTQFGELETTPTSRCEDQPSEVNNVPDIKDGPELSKTGVFDDGGLDDLDLVILESPVVKETKRTQSFAWSEAESATRRSSPVCLDKCPQDIWEFDDESLASPFSSPKPGIEALPDTLPLNLHRPPETQDSQTVGQRVDFSETASTLFRSSPAKQNEDGFMDLWDFRNATSSAICSSSKVAYTNFSETKQIDYQDVLSFRLEDDNTAADLSKPNPKAGVCENGASQVLKLNDDSSSSTFINQATSPHGTRTLRSLAVVKVKGHGRLNAQTELPIVPTPTKNPGPAQPHIQMSPELSTIETPVQESHSGKKRRQRAKVPLQFDSQTREVKEPPKKGTRTRPAKVAKKVPAVVALKKNTTVSSSPVTVARKRAKASKKLIQPKAVKPATKKQPTETPISDAAKKDADEGVCLAPSKLPAKRQFEAKHHSRITPCLRSRASDENDERRNQPLLISSDSIDAYLPNTILSPADVLSSPSILCIQPSNFEPSDMVRNPVKTTDKGIGAKTENPIYSRSTRGNEETKARHIRTLQINEEKEQSPKRVILLPLPAQNSKNTASVTLSMMETKQSLPSTFIQRQNSSIREAPIRNRQGNSGKQVHRNFSISEKGSPVRMNPQDENTCSSVSSQSLWNYKHRKQLNSQAGTTKPASPLICHSKGFNNVQELNGLSEVQKTGENTDDNHPLNPVPSQGQLNGASMSQRTRNDIHSELRAQLMESIHEQLKSSSDLEHEAQNTGVEEISSPATVQAKIHGASLSQHLHHIVDVGLEFLSVNIMSMLIGEKRMTKCLASKGEAISKIPEMYRAGGLNSVARIHLRGVKEQKILLAAFNQDAARFENILQQNMETVKEGNAKRKRELAELEDVQAQRHLQHQRAIKKLRALHSGLSKNRKPNQDGKEYTDKH